MPSLFSNANCTAHVLGDHGLWEQKALAALVTASLSVYPPSHLVVSKEKEGKVNNCLYLRRSSKSAPSEPESNTVTTWPWKHTHLQSDFTLLVIYTHFFIASSNWISLGLVWQSSVFWSLQRSLSVPRQTDVLLSPASIHMSPLQRETRGKWRGVTGSQRGHSGVGKGSGKR